MKIKEQKKYFYIFFFVIHPDRIPSNITVIYNFVLCNCKCTFSPSLKAPAVFLPPGARIR